MSSSVRRDMVAGGLAGLLGGLLGSAVHINGLTGLGLDPPLFLLLSILLGTAFGAVVRYQPQSYAVTFSSGLLFGLLCWIAGPLTLRSLLLGQQPGWSLQEARVAFPGLIGLLLYGGTTALCFYILETVALHLHPDRPSGGHPLETPGTSRPKRVVILGGGFSGIRAAQRLEQICAHDTDLEITLVSESNYLLFTPMLAGVASSGLEAQHISAPVRAILAWTHIRRASVESIDLDAQVVRVHTSPSTRAETLPYDHIVLALGAVPNYYDLPGLETHAFTLKTLQDAIHLRNHVITMLERADAEPDALEQQRQLTFVVAGGGFAGTELIAELFDLVHSVLRYYPNIPANDLHFVLIHSGERILPELSEELADYALRKLHARGIDVLLRTRVAGATTDAVLLPEGKQIPTRTLVWTAGNQANPTLQTLPCERNRAGAVLVGSTLQVKGFANVWAAGDCAQVPDLSNGGKPSPSTAQHALREGKLVAENVVAALHGRPLKPFRFRTLGTLVALGHHTAVAELRGWRFSGLLAWFLWRTVYLSKLPGVEKKVRVALDWALDLFFPRDIVLTSDTGGATVAAGMGNSIEQRVPRRQPALIEEREV